MGWPNHVGPSAAQRPAVFRREGQLRQGVSHPDYAGINRATRRTGHEQTTRRGVEKFLRKTGNHRVGFIGGQAALQQIAHFAELGHLRRLPLQHVQRTFQSLLGGFKLRGSLRHAQLQFLVEARDFLYRMCALRFTPFECFGHPIKGFGQLPQLVFAMGNTAAYAEVAGAHLLCRLSQ